MRKGLATLLAAVTLGTATIGTAGVSTAQDRAFDRAGRDRYIGSWCDRHRGNECRDWRANRSRWDDRHYRDWYRRHDHGNDAATAALFGLGVGALLGATVPNAIVGGGGRDVTYHVQRCASRYRSYDSRTDTYLGYDGYRHRCRL